MSDPNFEWNEGSYFLSWIGLNNTSSLGRYQAEPSVSMFLQQGPDPPPMAASGQASVLLRAKTAIMGWMGILGEAYNGVLGGMSARSGMGTWYA